MGVSSPFSKSLPLSSPILPSLAPTRTRRTARASDVLMLSYVPMHDS